jgi:hypothetical protein
MRKGHWVWQTANRGADFSDVQRAAVDWLIRTITQVRERAHMYIYPLTPEVFQNWRNGLSAGLSFVAVSEEEGIRDSVLARRQLQHTGRHHIVQELTNRGMSAEKIVDELLVIEIEVWQEQRKLMEDTHDYSVPTEPPPPPPD